MKIIDWFKNNLIIILIILLGVMGGVVVYQHISSLRSEAKITTLESDKKLLVIENTTLQSQVDNLLKIRESEDAALEELRVKQEEISSTKEDSNKELVTISERASDNDKSININSALPDDLIRLLNTHCNKVRGRDCSNP